MIKMIEGTCKGCGQKQLVKIEAGELGEEAEQKAADDLATEKCTCSQSEDIKAWRQAQETIERITSAELEKIGFSPIWPREREAIRDCARLVFDGFADSISIEVADSRISIKLRPDGRHLAIIRKSTLEVD